MTPLKKPVALAVFAHPDDIEFACAGTLALLRNEHLEQPSLICQESKKLAADHH